MRLTISATDQVTELHGVPVRLWEGMTSNGIRCKVFVQRLEVLNAEDALDFENELIALPALALPKNEREQPAVTRFRYERPWN